MDDFMRRAFELARLAEGRTWPRPAVGAVVVKDGSIVGEGFSQPNGGLHGEAVALREAGDHASGADLYVTLEPCPHVGSQPPCVDSIARASVARVFSTIEDPDLRVSGAGFAALANHGVEVIRTNAKEAESFYAPFVHRTKTSLPFVTLKLGMSLDAKVGVKTGGPRWITSEASRRRVHELRGQVDAVMVGAATVVADNPHLGCRLENCEDRQPAKIIIDSSGRTAKSDLASDPLAIFLTAERGVEAFANTDAKTIVVPQGPLGLDIRAAMKELGSLGLNWVLCEGGPQLASSLLMEDLINRFQFYFAGVVLGAQGVDAFPKGSAAGHFPKFHIETTKKIGDDIVMEGSCSQAS